MVVSQRNQAGKGRGQALSSREVFQILGEKERFRIFAVLSLDKELSEKEIASRARMSFRTCRGVLSIMAKQKMLSARTTGEKIFYSVNALDPMVRKVRNIFFR